MSDEPPQGSITRVVDGVRVKIGGSTVAEQQASLADVEAEQVTLRSLAQFVERFEDAIDALLSNNWDFLDAYSDRMWPGQNAVPDQWPQIPAQAAPTNLATAVTYFEVKIGVLVDRIELLRTQDSFSAYADTRQARAWQLVMAVLAEQIKRDPTLTPPADR